MALLASIKAIHEEKTRRQSNSPFTVEQEKFIFEKYTDLMSAAAVKRAFIKEYKKSESSKKLYKLHPKAFRRIFERFQKNGITASDSNPTH